MAQQLKKKFIGNNEVDGSKILLENNQPIRAKDQAGDEQEILKLDSSDKVVAKNGASLEEIAFNSQIESVEDRLDIIEGADTVEGSIAKAEKDAKDYADQKIADLVDSAPELLDTLNELAAALGDDENFAVTVADRFTEVEGDVSNLVTLSGVAVDSVHLGEFDETIIPDNSTIKGALQALETAIDSISGGGSGSLSALQGELDDTQVGAGLGPLGEYSAHLASEYIFDAESLHDADQLLDAAIKVVADNLAQEVLDRAADVDAEESRAIAAEGVLQSNIDAVASDLQDHISASVDAHDASAISFNNVASGLTAINAQDAIDEVEARVDTAESDISSLEGRMDTAESDINALEGRMDTAESDITSLEGRMDTAESDINALESDVADHETRILALESVVWGREKINLTSTDITNGYIDLAQEVVAGSISAFVDRLAIHQDEDFTVSVVGGVTRITFAGELIPPSGQSQLDENDNIYVRYQYLA